VNRPVLLYDGGCRFCRFAARVAARIDRGRYAYLPFDDDEAAPLLTRLPEATRYASAHLVRSNGSIWSPSSAPYRLVAGSRHRLGPLVPDGPGPRRYP
jgi:predicted DCC family thiol-disulfide oxidoreductase YuxK